MKPELIRERILAALPGSEVEVKDTTPVDYDKLSDDAIAEILDATRPGAE